MIYKFVERNISEFLVFRIFIKSLNIKENHRIMDGYTIEKVNNSATETSRELTLVSNGCYDNVL